MKFLSFLLALLLSLSAHSKHFIDGNGQFYQFVCPYPESKFNNVNTLIAIRQGSSIDISQIISYPDLITITSENGTSYPYTITLLSDEKTINIDALTDFDLSTTITVIISGLKFSDSGIYLEPLEFTFSTSQLLPAAYRKTEILSEMGFDLNEEIIEGDRIFPTITNIINNNPSDGNIFMGITGSEKYISILNNTASEPMWYELSGLNGNDFKVNENNMLSYYNREIFGWNIMNDMAEIVDIKEMVNGYNCDDHEFIILENGHCFMQSYDVQIFDMSTIVIGGNPLCSVEGYVMQELDENGGLVMQWTTWDHFNPTENTYLDLTGNQLFLWHGNAIEVDSDENILFSFRNTDEITKIDRNTGDILWRWGGGGSTVNQFNFTNDNKFTYQHDIRRLDNGNLMLYDNANYNPVQKSRCVEYSMNLNTMQVTKVWQYEHPDGLFAPSMGGCRRLENGNTFINWGNVINDSWGARVTEVNTQGVRVLEYAFPNGYNAYRSFKENWYFNEEAVGCPDPAAINYNPNATIVVINLCQYDYDGDGYSEEMGDCDDSNEDIGPDATEIPYDNVDQDCDGIDLTDVDGDTYSLEFDCDDNNDSVYPGANEIPYDGIDQDCSGADLTDVDGDGSPYPEDCNDEDVNIGPGTIEIANDGIDQDCSGLDFVDIDGDGFDSNTNDCDDTNENVYPGALEIADDGIDQDCSGFDLTDVDNDGFSADVDCNDNDENINPDAIEIPNDGIDQDCSGADFVDVDGDGFDANTNDCNDNDQNINPDMAEILSDGIDQDCDGEDLVAIEELFSIGIQMYPVPATDFIYLQLNVKDSYSIRIFSNTGKLVHENLTCSGNLNIPCSSWSDGIYQLNVVMGNKSARGTALVISNN
jgi:hypothetical protein